MFYVNFQNENQHLQEGAVSTLASVAIFSQVLVICFFCFLVFSVFVLKLVVLSIIHACMAAGPVPYML